MLDQAIRAMRTLYLHSGGKKGKELGFHFAQARIRILGSATADDVVLRLDFDYDHPDGEAWEAGQHFHFCFPSLSVWQSHPFTPSSLPDRRTKTQHHTYILRVRNGITACLAKLGDGAVVPAILTGPYGREYPSYGAENILAVAGGTGVTFTLAILLEAMRQQAVQRAYAIEFVWVVRSARDLLWLREEMQTLRALAREAVNSRVRVFVSREADPKQITLATTSNSEKEMTTATSTTSEAEDLQDLLEPLANYQVDFLGDHHPSMAEVIADFVERAKSVGGSSEIVGSGPEAMASDLRAAIAGLRNVEEVSFYWDSRE